MLNFQHFSKLSYVIFLCILPFFDSIFYYIFLVDEIPLFSIFCNETTYSLCNISTTIFHIVNAPNSTTQPTMYGTSIAFTSAFSSIPPVINFIPNNKPTITAITIPIANNILYMVLDIPFSLSAVIVSSSAWSKKPSADEIISSSVLAGSDVDPTCLYYTWNTCYYH